MTSTQELANCMYLVSNVICFGQLRFVFAEICFCLSLCLSMSSSSCDNSSDLNGVLESCSCHLLFPYIRGSFCKGRYKILHINNLRNVFIGNSGTFTCSCDPSTAERRQKLNFHGTFVELFLPRQRFSSTSRIFPSGTFLQFLVSLERKTCIRRESGMKKR